MPTDGGGLRDDLQSERPSQGEEDILRTAILVTDADSPTAEQVVLQLILARYAVDYPSQPQGLQLPQQCNLEIMWLLCKDLILSYIWAVRDEPLHDYRQEVKVMVNDVSTAVTAYGSYIAPVQGNTGWPH